MTREVWPGVFMPEPPRHDPRCVRVQVVAYNPKIPTTRQDVHEWRCVMECPMSAVKLAQLHEARRRFK